MYNSTTAIVASIVFGDPINCVNIRHNETALQGTQEEFEEPSELVGLRWCRRD